MSHNPPHTVDVCTLLIIDDYTYEPDANTCAAHVAGRRFAIVVVLLCNYGGPHVQKQLQMVKTSLCIFIYA